MVLDRSRGSFDFDLHTRVMFGDGSLSGLGEIARALSARRALLVTDPGVARAGHAARALASLSAAGVEARQFDQVVTNPTDRCVAQGLEVARGFQADLIAAVGGGSAMDAAKGIGLLLVSGGSITDYRGIGKVPRDLPPLIAVPTTAGTGSEVQSAALISSHASGEKMLLWDHRLAPRVAILDPALTATAPREVTALSGIDAIAHSVESYVSSRSTAFSRMFGREAFRLLLPALPAVLDGADAALARADMLLGATLAGLSIEHSMLGAAHSCANPLTARHGVAHGLAVGIMLPRVVRFNGRDPAVQARYGELVASCGTGFGPARRDDGLGGEVSERLAHRLEGLLATARLPGRLRDLGVGESDLPELAREAEKQWTASFNPRPVKAAEILEIYRWAL
jgi:alcohol dehydrogenase class IV